MSADNLALHEQPAAALAKIDDSNPIGAMLAGVCANGITKENVDAVKELTKLYMEVRADDAKRAYDAAFAQMQPEIGKIVAVRTIPKGSGIKFADHFDIQQHMEPILTRHGFTVSFTADTATPGYINLSLIISHKAGHRENRSMGSLVGSGGDFTPAQRASGTTTTLQRTLLCMAFNIPIDKHDAKLIGPAITAKQADELRQRIVDSGSSLEVYLRIANVDAIEKVPSTSLQLLHSMIDEKQRVMASKAKAADKIAELHPTDTWPGFNAAMLKQANTDQVPTVDAMRGIDYVKRQYADTPELHRKSLLEKYYTAATVGAFSWKTGEIV